MDRSRGESAKIAPMSVTFRERKDRGKSPHPPSLEVTLKGSAPRPLLSAPSL
jgi:hypothetical protein